MKKQSFNEKKIESRANANQAFFQKKSDSKLSANSGENENNSFSDKSSILPPPLTFNSEPVQKKKNENLPDKLQSNMEYSFGQDFSNVAIQKNSKEAVSMNARAFTRGENIHFAPGEFDTNSESGKNLIGHEFTHVVQQRSGIVKPTSVMQKGIQLNDDKGLEQEADHFGKKAVNGEAISSYSSSALGVRNALRSPVQAKSNVAQLAKHPSHYANWYDDTFNIRIKPNGQHSVEMDLKFEPKNSVDAELIGLTQTVRSIKNKKPYFINTPNKKIIEDRSIEAKDAIVVDNVTNETDEGTHIDQASYNRNPLYAAEGAPGSDKNLDDTLPVRGDVTKKNTWGRHGFRYMAGTNLKKQDALLHDETGLNAASKESGQIFETTALAIKGNQEGTYYGSVEWGWRTDSKGNFNKIPFKVIHQGVPSSTFMKSAEIWNATNTSRGESTLNLPIQDVKVISNPSGVNIGLGPVVTHLPQGTRVVEMSPFVSMVQTQIRVVDGPYIGEIGNVNIGDLSDERS